MSEGDGKRNILLGWPYLILGTKHVYITTAELLNILLCHAHFKKLKTISKVKFYSYRIVIVRKRPCYVPGKRRRQPEKRPGKPTQQSKSISNQPATLRSVCHPGTARENRHFGVEFMFCFTIENFFQFVWLSCSRRKKTRFPFPLYFLRLTNV